MGSDRDSARVESKHWFNYRRTTTGAGQRLLKRILVCCVVGIGVIFIPSAAWWSVRYCRVERTIHGFASNPSQAGANRLTALLEAYRPTRGQAARILGLLLQPKVNTRNAYPVDRQPTISTTLPCYLHFRRGITCRVDVRANEQVRSASYPRIQFGTQPDVLVCPVAPDQPGTLHMEVRYHYLLAPPPSGEFYFLNPVGRFLRGLLTRIKVEPWLPPPQEKWYQVRFQVAVDMNVVEPAQAEQVQLLSNPELDRRMKDVLRPEVWYRAPKELAGLQVHGPVLPADVAFHCFLELSDGTRITSSRAELRRLRGYAGWDLVAVLSLEDFRPDRPGTVALSLGDLMPLRPGAYDAKFVFEPDPNYAFEEPTIKSIWNGRLEFPIHFAIPPEPNAGR